MKMRNVLIALALVVAFVAPPSAAQTADELSQKTIICTGTLVQFNDGHFGLVADAEVEHGLCASARIPKQLLKQTNCQPNYPCHIEGRANSHEWIEIQQAGDWGQLQYFPEVGEYQNIASSDAGVPLYFDGKSYGQDEGGCSIKKIAVEPTSHTLKVTASCTVADEKSHSQHAKWHVDRINDDICLTIVDQQDGQTFISTYRKKKL
jgi:hypothetical protein